ncbi:MAG: ABC transporter ATP-binding protein [Verrucomicrobiota bacterium]
MSAFEAINLGKTYKTPQGPAVIVKDVNFKMHPGEFVCIIGHSGCGKSTVLSMVAGLNEITEGSVLVDNREINGAGPDRGVVFQSPCLLPWMSAFDNVMLGINQVYYHASKAEREQIARYYLSRVGLTEGMEKLPDALSQGMKQRVALARAFALAPKMLLLDEPFGMLDKLTKFDLQEVLIELWNREQLTAMMVTHDVDEAIYLADRVICMTNGPEAEIGEIAEIKFERPRDRHTILHDPRYLEYRQQLIGFLTERAEIRPSQLAKAKAA